MLVHNIRKNESRVIDFRETAPSAIQEEMLQTNLDLKVDPLSTFTQYSVMYFHRNAAHLSLKAYLNHISITTLGPSVTDGCRLHQ